MGHFFASSFETLKSLSGPFGLGGLVLYFIRDWRKNRVDTELAERTLPSSVRVRDAEGDQATLVTIERAFAMERESRELVIGGLRVELADRDRTIEALRGQVAALSAKLVEVTEEVQRLRTRVGPD